MDQNQDVQEDTNAPPAVEGPVKNQPDSTARLLAGTSLVCAVIALGYTLVSGQASDADRALTSEAGSEAAIDQAAKIGTYDLREEALLIVSMVTLEQALQASRPYAYELAVAMKAAQGHQEIAFVLDGLAPTSEVGVPSQEDLYEAWHTHLSSSFGITARVENAVNKVLNYDPEAQSDMQLLQSAHDHLKAGDLSAAVAVLSKLDGEMRNAVSPWLELATMRVEVDEKSKELRRLTYLSVLSDQV